MDSIVLHGAARRAMVLPEKKDHSTDPGKILRFHRSERILHWSIAIPFVICYTTALILVLVYNPAPLRPFRSVFSWIHRLSGACLIVLPLLTLVRHRSDYRTHIDNIRQGWIWALDDLKWLVLSAPAAISSKVALPEQGKFNAAEKLNFMMVMCTYPLFILTGILIWLPGIAFYSWMLHFALAAVVTPLLVGHIFMATVNPSTRVGLSGMISGFVDRKWARHHYGRWYRENFTEPSRVPGRYSDDSRVPAQYRPAGVCCSGHGEDHIPASCSLEVRDLQEADQLRCQKCGSEVGVVTLLAAPRDIEATLQLLEEFSGASFGDAPLIAR